VTTGLGGDPGCSEPEVLLHDSVLGYIVQRCPDADEIRLRRTAAELRTAHDGVAVVLDQIELPPADAVSGASNSTMR
jgi:hypothetical protein